MSDSIRPTTVGKFLNWIIKNNVSMTNPLYNDACATGPDVEFRLVKGSGVVVSTGKDASSSEEHCDDLD